MKELLARIVYLFVGHVLWVLVGYDRVTYVEDNGHIWEAKWWVFSEYGDQQHETVTRGVLGIGVWYWDNKYHLTRWWGRRIHFAYRHSFGSGKGLGSFFKLYAVAYRLGL